MKFLVTPGSSRFSNSNNALFYTNYDLSTVVTPVNAQVFHQLLTESNYDPAKTDYLITGFRQGFDLGYRGPKNVQLLAPNLKLRLGNQVGLVEQGHEGS